MAISDVQLKGSWYAVFDDDGKKIKELSCSNVGEFCGHGTDIMVFKKGSWFGAYDATGKKLKEFAEPVGDFRGVSGRTIIFQKGNWIDTYDLSGKKLNSRPA